MVADMKVDGLTQMVGTLEAHRASFKHIDLTAHKAVLKDVLVDSITVKSNGVKNPHILSLEGKTVVLKDIVFEKTGKKNKNIVWIGKNAKIEGKVIGGIIKKSS
jgi:hypothetical protein